MATIEYFVVRIKNLEENRYLDHDCAILLKDKIDKLTEEEKYCQNRTCAAILAEYIENTSPTYSITFDFSKLSDDSVTSAIKSKILENIDTFKELDEKTLELISYSIKEKDLVSECIDKNNELSSLIKSLESLDIEFYKIYKIIKEEKLNKIINKKSLLDEFYKKNLKRFKKDKTFFNIFRLDKKNILQCQKNTQGFDFKKIEQYINEHLLNKENLHIIFERIYDAEFIDMLKHHDLKKFEIKYHSESKHNLLNKELNSFLFQLSDSLGRNQTKIIAQADKGTSLNNEKIVEFFYQLSEMGILDECKIRSNNNNFDTSSNSKGSLLKFANNSKMTTLQNANIIFLDSYEKNIDIIKERVIL